MLQEPQLSPYDLQFSLLGFHVRVAWGFWILAAVIGWQYVQVVDHIYAEAGLGSPGAGLLLLVWTASLFLSILIHELGHSLMHRFYGMDSRIVLYHFGGLAVPGSFTAWNAARRRFVDRPQQLILISLAGPAAQLLLALLVWALATAMHIDLGLTRQLERWMNLSLPEREPAQSAALFVATDALVTQSVYWALLNLLPILPLDGGNVFREVLRLFGQRDPWRTAALVSMITAGVLGIYMLQHDQPGFGLLCLSFVASNFQLYQSGGLGRY
ncbi:MAG: site-2 protease family protein [Aureliella sp.]